MRSVPLALAGAASVLLFFGTAGARAELIQWSYSWSRSPTQVYANSPGTGYISLTESNGLKSAAGDSYLVATNLQAHSTAGVADPDVFTNKTYSLSLYLQDNDSSKSGTVTFTGEFNGTLTADSSNITNTFVGATTQSLVLGDHLYTVTIGPYDPPGPTGAVNSGSISARAEVTVSTIFHLPEPSSAMLALLGGSCGLAFVRRRRRVRETHSR
ncbi:MAG TPA: PEP-CTERM sorting domain-containing protein [Gemmataceae bacterium]|nr:PEP-CTERM sorting domain-containing protein [Gemmataceae bacterium]